MSAIKENRQVFAVILGSKIDLNEALKFPITAVPLCLRNLDGIA